MAVGQVELEDQVGAVRARSWSEMKLLASTSPTVSASGLTDWMYWWKAFAQCVGRVGVRLLLPVFDDVLKRVEPEAVRAHVFAARSARRRPSRSVTAGLS